MALNLSIDDFFQMGVQSGSLGGGGATKTIQDQQAQQATLAPAAVSALGSFKSAEASASVAGTASDRLAFDKESSNRQFGLDEKRLSLEERRVTAGEKDSASLGNFREGTLGLQQSRLDLDTRKALLDGLKEMLGDDVSTLYNNVVDFARQEFGLDTGFLGFNVENPTPEQLLGVMEFVNELTMGKGLPSILPQSPQEVDQIGEQLAALAQEKQAILAQGGGQAEGGVPTGQPEQQAQPAQPDQPEQQGGPTLAGQALGGVGQGIGQQFKGLGQFAQGALQQSPVGLAGPVGGGSIPAASPEQVGKVGETLQAGGAAGAAGAGDTFTDMRGLFKILGKMSPQELQLIFKLLQEKE